MNTTTLTYAEARNKILDAYFKDEIKPFDMNFCFCGTLAGGVEWAIPSNINGIDKKYTKSEYTEMESALLYVFTETFSTVVRSGNNPADWQVYDSKYIVQHPEYENVLFRGMEKALEVLKEIHRSRGEDVDNPAPSFTKRSIPEKIA